MIIIIQFILDVICVFFILNTVYKEKPFLFAILLIIFALINGIAGMLLMRKNAI